MKADMNYNVANRGETHTPLDFSYLGSGACLLISGKFFEIDIKSCPDSLMAKSANSKKADVVDEIPESATPIASGRGFSLRMARLAQVRDAQKELERRFAEPGVRKPKKGKQKSRVSQVSTNGAVEIDGRSTELSSGRLRFFPVGAVTLPEPMPVPVAPLGHSFERVPMGITPEGRTVYEGRGTQIPDQALTATSGFIASGDALSGRLDESFTIHCRFCSSASDLIFDRRERALLFSCLRCENETRIPL